MFLKFLRKSIFSNTALSFTVKRDTYNLYITTQIKLSFKAIYWLNILKGRAVVHGTFEN